MTTVLILSVGSVVGSNILDACAAFRPQLRVVGINSEAEAPNNFCCDQVFLAPPACEAQAYWQCVESVLEREKPDLVMAGRDDDISLLGQWRDRYPHWADRFVVGASALSLPMTDKLAGHDWAITRGLPFAPTAAANDPRANEQCTAWMAELKCALIAKPRVGNASRGIRLLLNDAALLSVLGDSALVIQPYLSDATPYLALAAQSALGLPLFWTPTLTQYVAQAVIGPEGNVIGRFDMQAKMVAGRCEHASVFDDAGFREIGDRYSRALASAGWRGPISVQMVHHPGLGFQAIEFNAPSGAMMPRLLLGFDEMALTLSAWTRKAFIRRPPQPVNTAALRVTRDIGLQAWDAAYLRENGTWPRSC